MKIQMIKYGADEQPKELSFRMTMEEAAYILSITGVHSDETADMVVTGGAALNGSIFDSLTGVFNTHFRSGLDGYLRGDTE